MATPAAPEPKDLTWRATWAANAIKQQIAAIQTEAKDLPDASVKDSLRVSDSLGPADSNAKKTFNVAIVGAGCAGLFTAMIFDHLKESKQLDVNYTILEANQKDRLGGRLYTYHFPQPPEKSGHPKVGSHDYFDVGAMRFPRVSVMDRTFQLFEELKMKYNSTPEKTAPEYGDLIPYYFTGPNTPLLYNGIRKIFPDRNHDPTAAEFEITNVPEKHQHQGAGGLVEAPVKDYLDLYNGKVEWEGQTGPKAFWARLMKEADSMSVRQYFSRKDKESPDYSYDTIEFLETFNTGNRWYDQAVSEMILEILDFDSSAPWWCVEGGAQEIARRMEGHLKQKDKIRYGKRVTAMSYVNKSGKTDDQINVTINGEEDKPEKYDAVFNSATLGCMQRMNLKGLNLNWGTKQAIRSLGYGASCKVGIRFRTLWWKKAPYNINLGGVGKTDLPLQACVYPSYNVHDENEEAGVLLCSYSWSQQAQRMASLIDRKSPENEAELRDVLIHDLARLHTDNDADFFKLQAELEKEYLDHYAWDWYSSSTASGAFAYFGPGQFHYMYPWITRSDGKHMIIGEAASAHHAWVVGGLESASRAVYQFVYRHSSVDKAAADCRDAFQQNQVRAPFGPIPAEYDRTQDQGLTDQQEGIAFDASPLGDLARWQVLIEKTRQQQGGEQLDPSGPEWEKNVVPLVKTTAS